MRINDLLDEAADLCEPVTVDPALLTSGGEAELTAYPRASNSSRTPDKNREALPRE